MIELKLYVSEVDFDSVIQRFAGSGSMGSMAAMAAGLLSDSAKEELAAKYLNASSDKLEAMLQDAAERQGLHMRLSGAQARVVEKAGEE